MLLKCLLYPFTPMFTYMASGVCLYEGTIQAFKQNYLALALFVAGGVLIAWANWRFRMWMEIHAYHRAPAILMEMKVAHEKMGNTLH